MRQNLIIGSIGFVLGLVFSKTWPFFAVALLYVVAGIGHLFGGP